MRMITFSTLLDIHTREHTNNLFYQNRVLKYHDLYNLSLSSFMYQLAQETLPQNILDLFRRNQDVHNYPTRQSSLYHLPLTRTLCRQRTFLYQGPQLWNSLSSELQSSVTIYSFKRRLKRSLIDAYRTPPDA